jgi:hypothetical protein
MQASNMSRVMFIIGLVAALASSYVLLVRGGASQCLGHLCLPSFGGSGSEPEPPDQDYGRGRR